MPSPVADVFLAGLFLTWWALYAKHKGGDRASLVRCFAKVRVGLAWIGYAAGLLCFSAYQLGSPSWVVKLELVLLFFRALFWCMVSFMTAGSLRRWELRLNSRDSLAWTAGQLTTLSNFYKSNGFDVRAEMDRARAGPIHVVGSPAAAHATKRSAEALEKLLGLGPGQKLEVVLKVKDVG